MSHRNARLTVHGRRLLVERVQSGRPVAHVAAEMGVSRATAHKWVRRWRQEGEAGLADRPSRPHSTPHRTPADVEAKVCELRTARKLGPARIGPILDLPPSTAWGTRTQTILIQGSTDGTNYTTLAASQGYTFNPSTGNTVTVTFTSSTVRYVKLTFTANTGWPAGQLSELEIFTS